MKTIKFEGELLKPWIDEVRKECTSNTDPSGYTRLDLSDLTFVDEAGAELLRELIARGIEIVACSSYLAKLLSVSPSEG